MALGSSEPRDRRPGGDPTACVPTQARAAGAAHLVARMRSRKDFSQTYILHAMMPDTTSFTMCTCKGEFAYNYNLGQTRLSRANGRGILILQFCTVF